MLSAKSVKIYIDPGQINFTSNNSKETLGLYFLVKQQEAKLRIQQEWI